MDWDGYDLPFEECVQPEGDGFAVRPLEFMMTAANGSHVTYTSLTLLGRLREQDPDSWECFCRIYAPFVWRWSGLMGLPPSDREDIVQEVFSRVHRAINDFRRMRNGSFRSWLKTITGNVVRDHFRQNGRDPHAIGGTDALRMWRELPIESRETEEAEEAEVVQSAIRVLELGLSAEHERVVRRLLEGGLPKDVAAECELTHANVLKIWSRAKRSAREWLDGLQLAGL